MKKTRRRTLKNHHRIMPAPGSTLIDARLLTYAQAAAKLEVNIRTLKGWVAEGKIDVVRFGSHCVRFTVDALDRFTADHTQEARN